MYLTSIVLHSAAGVICFFAAVMLLVRLRNHGSMTAWWWVYLLSISFLFIYTITAVASHWGELSDPERYAFPALILLALYMLFRAWQSFMEWYVPHEGWRQRLINHVGFNLISLFEGLLIVGAIDLRFPAPVVGLLALLGIVAGSMVVGRVKQMYEEPTTA
jgi:hypothetical protein